MRVISCMCAFTMGAAVGAGVVVGLDQLNRNKYMVKKTINDAIDNVTDKMN